MYWHFCKQKNYVTFLQTFSWTGTVEYSAFYTGSHVRDWCSKLCGKLCLNIHNNLYTNNPQWQQNEQYSLFLYLQLFLLWIYFDLLSGKCLWRASRKVLSELGSENLSVRKGHGWFLMIDLGWCVSSG